MKTITVRFAMELYVKIKDKANQEDRSVAYTVTKILEDYFRKEED